jgi:DNA-binding NarL/FixJ family response regulator
MGTQLLRNTLARDARFELLPPEAASVEEAARASVSLVSANLQDGPQKGLDFVRQLKSIRPDAKIVVLVDSTEREVVMEVFRAGARGIFCRNDSSKLLARCMWSVHKGQVWASSTETGYLLESLRERIPMKLVDAKGSELLSSREQDVVAGVAAGLSNREIANQLKLSEHTVKNYLFRIFEKLGVANRVELILYAVNQLSDRPEPVAVDPFRDEASIFSWYRQAAENCGVTPYAIAEMYRDGRGVPASQAGALMWYMVAETVCKDVAAKSRVAQQNLRSRMGAEDIKRARQQAIAWLKAKHAVALEQYGLQSGLRQHDGDDESQPSAA